MTKRVVVTGASSGIGAAAVRLFREHGWHVVAVARRADRLEALAVETGCEPFPADLTDQASIDALAEHLGADPVHAVVNNAGGAYGLASIEQGDVADWRYMFEINVIATKQVTAALLPLLRRTVAAEGGSADIVSITSIAGHLAYEGGGGYNAAKFAEHALMAVLRQELAGEPIRVVEIAPGLVHTEEFSLTRFGGDQVRADAVYEGVENPLVAEDVAEAIVHAVELPSHVNLDLLTIKPVAQAKAQIATRGPLTPKL
jgi:NADP-dependent 3-hydroxy acid dehydrogenase YdfG